MKGKVCYSTNAAGFDIILRQQGKDNFSVQYGQQLDSDLRYLPACEKLGQAILHALVLEGKIEPEED